MFKLYPFEKESATFRHVDYSALITIAKGAKSVLEFGPGISTLALIEAEVPKIVTLEHDPEWYDKAKEEFAKYPQVEVRRYVDDPVATAELADDEVFDLAVVDSPKGFIHKVKGVKGMRKRHPGQEDCSRYNTCLLALKHSPVVFLHDAYRPYERATLGRLSAAGHRIDYLGCSDGELKTGMARILRDGQDPARISLHGVVQPGGIAAGAEPRQ